MSDRTYGGWTAPGRKGLGGLSMGLTLLLFAAALVAIVMVLTPAGLIGALIVLAVAGLASIPLAVRSRSQSRTLGARLFLRLRRKAATRRGESVLVQGPAGLVRDGKCRLPGLAASSELLHAEDAYGTPFGIIRLPWVGHYTMVIECSPDGLVLVDDERVDQYVAQWGAWMNQLGQDNADIIGAQVVVESRPDPGVRLARAIDRSAGAERGAFVVRVMDEIKERYPVGQADISTRVTITLSERLPGSSKRTPAQMADRMGNAAPMLIGTLQATGAGRSPRLLDSQDIIDMVRAAYDPAVAFDVEEAREQGGTGLTWEEAGPTFADVRVPEVYVHDRGSSVSWQMVEPPRSAVWSDVLQRLLQPSRDIAVKRVALLYRPQDTATASKVAEAEVSNATFSLNSRVKPQHRDELRLRQAHQAASEEASGAGLIRFGMIVTATTISDRHQLPQAREVIRQLSASARVRLRPAIHAQDVVFQAGLPLGLVLPRHLAVPAEIRESI